jgi:hypothetical protein
MTTDPDESRVASYPAIDAKLPPAEDVERQLATAWAWLAAERVACPAMRRVTVLRPFAF